MWHKYYNVILLRFNSCQTSNQPLLIILKLVSVDLCTSLYKSKKQLQQLQMLIGMAGPKNTQTRVVGIIRSHLLFEWVITYLDNNVYMLCKFTDSNTKIIRFTSYLMQHH